VILLTRLRGGQVYVSADLIEEVEATPDTVLTLTSGRKIVVQEGVEEVVRRVVAYRCRIARAARPRVAGVPASRQRTRGSKRGGRSS
jgi:flagellar protein FlbD